jgi:hypothetical protein
MIIKQQENQLDVNHHQSYNNNNNISKKEIK